MRKVYINSISYYLPPDVLSNDDINRDFPEWSVDKISAKTGIYRRHLSGSETTADMGIKAAEGLFLEWGIDRSKIDFILFCTQSPDYFLPTTACLVQDKLGLPTSAGALDFNLGCSGYVYGLSLAKGLVASGIAKNVLLITSEAYTKHINFADKSNKTIFGDAATATLISNEKGIACIEEFIFGTDGSGAEHLIIRNGGTKNPRKDAADVLQEDGTYERNDNFLYMNGKEIFNFTAAAVPVLVKEVVAKNGVNFQDIDLFVFHQANRYMLNFIRKKIAIPEDKFYISIEDYGNTVSSTIPIALYNAQKEGRLSGNIILAGFGVGLSWGGCLIKAL
ncbi:3-oxoacyl-[acyl-carrier-protein] synthase, KASIII [Mucinivorans hirudinis]|uniref:3-oxoacyl-[acyl-carrier-protein] synthase, KASIII n=1 Tax=Mucinivorans hirudinis TaxID=1433126 RepID=A0A060RB11_9BACT|nr:3-oxoacyl-[acyl-carrier-protein] synthase, KASIII [Mucinivorans hirudinis]